jgi:2-amino-4-hydroxy-6-hydroxymethyldihydropteridine diphosphokinase
VSQPREGQKTSYDVDSSSSKSSPGTPVESIGAMPERVYLSLGSNLGDRELQLKDALARLSTVGRVLSLSSFYETEPVEFTQQPWFLNCVVALETGATPQQLITAILQIERDMGRQRLQNKGPRAIDIDILLFGDQVIDSPQLSIPHPAMQHRRFVLEPLAEIAPDLQHPTLKKTIQELRDALPSGQEVRRITPREGQRPTTND